MAKTFLAAEWRKLLMFNYSVDEKLLQPYVPKHTVLDHWHGKCFISLVGFMFLDTKLLGLKIPFHRNFEEVNLRFYVKHFDGKEWKRGVVFIKEIVPKIALSLVANTVYGEKYETMPMKHLWEYNQDNIKVAYSWKKDMWHTMSATTARQATAITTGSEEEFITEHYWGYTQSRKGAFEYGVEHPKWDVYKVLDYAVDVDFSKIYGTNFAYLNSAIPSSVFLAEGSEILVNSKRKLA